jgi:uncharacterized protein (TIGR03435 family)
MRYFLALLAIGLTTVAAWAQPSFEVATIKPAVPSSGAGGQASTSGDTVSFRNTTLLNILVRAFQLKFPNQVEGPSWIFTERYDIVARAPANTPKDQIAAMLRTLLMERFKPVLHHETRDFPSYALALGKKPLALRPAQDANQAKDSAAVVRGRRQFKDTSTAALAGLLSQMLRAPVLDETGLQGGYDFSLERSLEEAGGVNNPAVTAPSIFTLIEDLGLKMEPRKTSLDVVVIDSGEKVPVEN